MEEQKFMVTTNLQRIAQLKRRIRIVQGGSSAGKTFSIIPLLINYAIEMPNSMISVVSESMPHLKRGAMRDFENIMRLTNRWVEGALNKQESTYKFKNGSKIEFFSADQPDKLRGARRDVLFVNEANNIRFEAYQQLAMRTNAIIYIDFNPVSEFWAHTELQDDPDSDFIILTYKGNEALPMSIREHLQKAERKAKTSPFWHNWVEVYVYGRIGRLTGAIYSNWSKINEIPKEAELLGYGMDFGFSNDPTAIAACYRYNGRLLWEEVLYEKGLTNTDLNTKMKKLGMSKTKTIFADSAEPKTIEELSRYGWNIKPTKKGRDSINFGISILSSQDEMGVTTSSNNMINELRNYIWETDRDGHKINTPIDKYNHLMDAMRYFAMMRLTKHSDFFVI